MKKRLLITSIVMMLVVAVAISTATYAWFTSNSSVNASSVSLTASTNSAPSLGISWVDGNYGTSITAVGPTAPNPSANPAVAGDVFAPACPATLTVGTTLSTVDFTTALTTPANGGDMVFLSDGATTDVYTWTDETHTSFFLKNLSPSNQINSVTMNVSITGDGAGLIRVGVFKKDGANGYKLVNVIANQESNTYTAVSTAMDNSTTYYKKYLGKYVQANIGTEAEVTAKTADYFNGMTPEANTFYTSAATSSNARAVYGTVQGAASVNALSSLECVTSTTVATNLTAGGTVELIVKVWEDAVALGDAEQGQAASIAITFAAA